MYLHSLGIGKLIATYVALTGKFLTDRLKWSNQFNVSALVSSQSLSIFSCFDYNNWFGNNRVGKGKFMCVSLEDILLYYILSISFH